MDAIDETRELADRLTSMEQNLPPWTRTLLDVLTAREREAFVLSQSGKTHEEIGRLLAVSGNRAGQLGRTAAEKMTEAARRSVDLVQRIPAMEPHALPSCRAAGGCEVPPSMVRVLDLPVSTLNLGLRAEACLEGAGIVCVGQLIAKTDLELLRIAYLGRRTLKDLKAAVAALGLHLGMNVGSWMPPPVIERSGQPHGRAIE